MFDVSGEVVEVGSEVSEFKIGDQVFTRVPTNEPGSIAEFVTVDSSVVAIKPNNTSFDEAAGFPVSRVDINTSI